MLDDFILPSRVNARWNYSGIDSPHYCFDKQHFKQYPYEVSYQYNSRGFRDDEWPDDLQNAIWCVGDSFTVGLGCPQEHTWPSLLKSKLGVNCINLGLDGGSNAWMCRKIHRLLEAVEPKVIVVQWSFLHRSEHANTDLNDELRRIEYVLDDMFDLYVKMFDGIKAIEQSKKSTQIIHSFIPDCYENCQIDQEMQKLWNQLRGESWSQYPKDLAEFNCINELTRSELGSYYDKFDRYFHAEQVRTQIQSIPEIKKLDLARDGFHYDIVTARDFVEKLASLISLPR